MECGVISRLYASLKSVADVCNTDGNYFGLRFVHLCPYRGCGIRGIGYLHPTSNNVNLVYRRNHSLYN